MTSSGESRRGPALASIEAAAALERRIGHLAVLADRHAAAGRLTSVDDARALILRLQDELDDLHAGR